MPAESQDREFSDHDKLVRILTIVEGQQRDFGRMETELKDLRRETKDTFDKLEGRIDALESRLDTGTGVGKGVMGALGALPFVGGLVGYFISERGGS